MASAKLGALHRAVIEINREVIRWEIHSAHGPYWYPTAGAIQMKAKQRIRFFLSPSNNSCTAVPTIGHGTPIALDGAVEIFLL
jgi:hypothetical protein